MVRHGVEQGPTVDRLRSPLAWIGAAYVGLRVWSYWHVFRAAPVIYPDSRDYLRVASFSIFSSDFYTWWKPWGLPLFYKLLPGSTVAVAPTAQWLVSVASWLVLSAVVARELRHAWVRVAAFVIVLGLSLTSIVLEWDGALLTESLSISLSALLVAALLAVVRRPGRRNVALTLLAAFALVITRESNAYLLLLLLLPLAFLLARRGERRLAIVLAATMTAIAVASYATYNIRHWEGPMTDVIVMKVIPNPAMTAYFEARGMPAVRPGLWTELVASRVPPSRFERDPKLAFFRPWFMHHVRATYVGYLLRHPGLSLWEPIRNLPLMIDPGTALPTGLDFFRPPGLKRALPRRLADVFYPRGGWLVLAWVGIAGALALFYALIGLGRRSWVVPGLLLASTLPLALIIWDGDPLGLDRHAIQVALDLRIGFWLLVLFVLDALVSGRQPENR